MRRVEVPIHLHEKRSLLKKGLKEFLEETEKDEGQFCVTYGPCSTSDDGAAAPRRYRAPEGSELLGIVDNS